MRSRQASLAPHTAACETLLSSPGRPWACCGLPPGAAVRAHLAGLGPQAHSAAPTSRPRAPRPSSTLPCCAVQASQDFDPSTRRVVNRGELLGGSVTVTASGSYAPVPRDGPSSGSGSSRPGGSGSGGDSRRAAAGRCPVLVRASIEGGELQAGAARLPLPIRCGGRREGLPYRMRQTARAGTAVQQLSWAGHAGAWRAASYCHLSRGFTHVAQPSPLVCHCRLCPAAAWLCAPR